MPDNTPVALGVLGMFQLGTGSVLVIITKATQVLVLDGHPVYRVCDTQLLVYEGIKENVADVRLVAALRDSCDPKSFGSHLYFSYAADITCRRGVPLAAASPGSGGQLAPTHASHLWGRADPTYVWNAHLCQPLIAAGAEPFALPLLVGYVGQFRDAELADASGHSVSATITLIGRMAVARSGTRLWRRGCDAQGNAAHTVESEVIISFHESSSPSATTTTTTTAAAAGRLTVTNPHLNPSSSGDTPPTLGVYRGPDPHQGPNTPCSTAPVLGPAAAAVDSAQAETATASGPPGSKPTALATASYVSMQCSTPLAWAQPPDVTPVPALDVCRDPAVQGAVFAGHARSLQESFPETLLLALTRNAPHHLRLHSLLLSTHSAWKAHTQLQQHRKDLSKQHVRQPPPRDNPPHSTPPTDAAVPPLGSDSSATAHSTLPQQPVEPKRIMAESVGHVRAQAGGEVQPAPEESGPQPGTRLGCSLVGHLVSDGACYSLLEREGQLQLLGRIYEDLARHSHCYSRHPTNSSHLPGTCEKTPCPSDPDPAAAAAAAAAAAVVHTPAIVSETASQDATDRAPSVATTQAEGADTQHTQQRVGVAAGLSEVQRAGQRQGQGRRQQQQWGVVCVSSSDGPDDSNAVQFVLAQEFVRRELESQGLLQADCSLQKAYPELADAFATLWAHHGDVLSDQMNGCSSASSSSIKAGGKPRLWDQGLGLVDAVCRYGQSTYADAKKQDAIDLLTGAYRPLARVHSVPTPAAASRPPSTTQLQMSLLLLAWPFVQTFLFLHQGSASLADVLLRVFLPFLAGGLMLGYILRQGTQYLQQPELCRERIRPWGGVPPSGDQDNSRG
ncbi:MAG: hypothetical protein WDW36_007292 [Sanguina aurantia]